MNSPSDRARGIAADAESESWIDRVIAPMQQRHDQGAGVLSYSAPHGSTGFPSSTRGQTWDIDGPYGFMTRTERSVRSPDDAGRRLGEDGLEFGSAHPPALRMPRADGGAAGGIDQILGRYATGVGPVRQAPYFDGLDAPSNDPGFYGAWTSPPSRMGEFARKALDAAFFWASFYGRRPSLIRDSIKPEFLYAGNPESLGNALQRATDAEPRPPRAPLRPPPGAHASHRDTRHRTPEPKSILSEKADGGKVVKAKAQSPTPGLLPFYMQRPPKMSDEDVALYRGAAYGTPHEPYIKGPSEAATLAHSLRSPALNYGLDLARVRELPPGEASRKFVDEEAGGPAHGVYDPDTRLGYAVPDPRISPGSTLAHEALHHAYATIASDLAARVPATALGTMPASGDPDYWGKLGRAVSARDIRFGDMQHRLMDYEERMTSPRPDRTRMVPDVSLPKAAIGIGGHPDDYNRVLLDYLNDSIDWLRRQRGDFSRTGPR